MDMKRWIREEILAQRAYAVEGQDCPVKMDAMENPYVLPPALREALGRRLESALLNRYPEAGARRLRSRYARYFGVDEDMLMVGNGSDELISILCTAVASPGSSILVPVPTFAVYRIVAINCGLRVLESPLDENFDLDLRSLLDLIGRERPAILFLSYPNNPTGNCFDRNRIEALIEASPGFVVVDEAYFNFSGQTFLPLLPRHENLIILRTLSKAGLAGIRVGFLMGASSLVGELDKIRLPYNINTLSQIVAAFYLEEETEFQNQSREIIAGREELFRRLGNVKGIRPWTSAANFIFFSCDFDADRIYRHLLNRGILIKNLSAPGRMRNCMRVTVGKPEENAQFIEVLERYLTTQGA